MVLFGIYGHAERICHFLEREDVLNEVIIYLDAQREDVQIAPHGVFHMTSINIDPEVFL